MRGEFYPRMEHDQTDAGSYDEQYKQLIASIGTFLPYDCENPGELLKKWAEQFCVDEKIFKLLYTRNSCEKVVAFINRLVYNEKGSMLRLCSWHK